MLNIGKDASIYENFYFFIFYWFNRGDTNLKKWHGGFTFQLLFCIFRHMDNRMLGKYPSIVIVINIIKEFDEISLKGF